MRDYTPEETEQLHTDLAQLHNFWDRFRHEYQQGANSSLHPPPIIVQAVASLLSEILGIGPENFENPQVYSGFVNITAVMFQFGQFCFKGGLYEANMQQCICCKVDDLALRQVLKDGH